MQLPALTECAPSSQASLVHKKILWSEWESSNTELQRLQRDQDALLPMLQARQRELDTAEAPLARRRKEVADLDTRYKATRDTLSKQQQSTNTGLLFLSEKLTDKVWATHGLLCGGCV